MEQLEVTVLRANGKEDKVMLPADKGVVRQLTKLLDAEAFGLDSFRDGNGNRVWVDDMGIAKMLPVNDKATKMYHSICVPGTTHQIRGDVAIVSEADMERIYA